jgi:penicillin-binding protein 2
MIVGLAALKAGIIKENTTFFCPGHYQLGKQRFNCWKPTGHGNMNLHDALAQSCDTFFYKIATELPMEKINEMAREFGLGDSIDIALPGEKAGLLPDGAWKRERFGQIWLPGDTVNASIGQGYVLATPIQLAVMTARIANGGKKIMPRLVKDPNFTPADSLSIPKHHMRVIKEGMEAVTGTKEGTAYWQRILNPDYAMAGKTGTSQVKRILTRGQKQEELPWHHRHHALFVGYAPLANPKYVVSVVIEHGGSGSAAAAPVARDILEKIQQLSAEPVASFTKNTI